ncbi:copper chaperone [Brevibacterium ravenspurgense]|uniref:Copper chaperone n=1 Tax=Brevibacterium ravenspurgense TaxID=479117 RepID=A0A150H5T7_9MICO|nr:MULTISPECIES: cation transporter [Brevibacterium]KXZ57456.1 Copper chaperone CopZ [Brevibacterium ravenspurgense]MCG7300692.1 cation transporter [Brevibacterium ravenspurgense]OFT93271.1 heavy metal transporter [Brevibacterium sp. HMSC24B04]OFT96251.1 heavy metal transporter [Brevibacterium sp. HMSC22B09]PKY70680.1 copper chaperone [Brevibacterium ravenspurgense]
MATTTINVSGLTCNHCVNAVKDEVGAIDGVQSVNVELVEGGISPVTIESATPLAEADLNDAIDEAGYTIVK